MQIVTRHSERSKKIWTIFFILFLSAIARITGLGHPHKVVFDETHYGGFVRSYVCTHENAFDVHPPHAKLLMVVATWFANLDCSFEFRNIGVDYGAIDIAKIRILPAIFGSSIPALAMILIQLWGGGLAISTLAGFALALDNGFIVQSRVLSLDIILLSSMLFSLVFLTLALQTKKRGLIVTLAIIGGAFGGLCLGSKMTGLVLIPLSLLLAWAHPNKTARSLVTSLGFFFTILFAVYLGGWVIHFALIQKPGNADLFYTLTGNFWTDLWNLHIKMIEANANIKPSIGDFSRWWQWPTINRPIYYSRLKNADIYFMGNPTVWWGVSFLTIAGILDWGSKFKSLNFISLALLGFLFSYLPFIFINRPTYLYYFLQPLMFAILFCALDFDKKIKYKKCTYGILSLLIVTGFLVVAPVTYGLPKDFIWGQLILELIPSWR